MSRPRVLIDVERIRQPNSGLGQVALHLVNQYLREPPDDFDPVFLIPEDKLDFLRGRFQYEVPSWRRRYARSLAPEYNLWHMLHQDASYLPGPRTPYLLTINDLNFLFEKGPAKARKRLRKVQRLVDGASAITVISRFTESVVREHLDVGDTPIHVVYIGLGSDPTTPGERPDFVPDGPFLFNVGVVRRKKNQLVLIDFLAETEDIKLVIAGNTKDDYAGQILDRVAALGLGDRVIMPGEISEEHKSWLFQNCEAFVFPSLHEGFGLPVAEAMSHGKPTFSSTRSSLPEVGGDDVFYWDDFDASAMASVYRDGMEAFRNEPGLSDRLVARAATFSWANCAKRYAELYRQLWRS